VDIDFSLAPVVDLEYGRSVVIGDRALHHDSAVVASLARAFLAGARAGGMACVAKHFPGHGWVMADSHKETPVDSRDYALLRADLLPFERLIEDGLGAVMTAHVQYGAIDAAIPCYSERWLKAELRERMGFTGAIFSDDLSMRGAGQAGGARERAAAALQAGCDMLPVCNDPDGARELLDGWNLAPNPGSEQRLAALSRAR